MTFGEMLTMIGDLYPYDTSTWTNQKVANLINEHAKTIFKDMNRTTSSTTTTVADQEKYAMAADCTADLIVELNVRDSYDNITTYQYKRLQDELVGYCFYDALGGYVGLYPVPDTSGYTITYYYKPRATTIAYANLNSTVGLNTDYHMLFVYYVCSEIANSGHYADTGRANQFIQQYNALYRKMKADKWSDYAYYPKVKDVNRKLKI